MKGHDNKECCFECQYNCTQGIFTEDDLHLINQNKSEMHFALGESLLRQGAFVSQVCFLRAGLVKNVLEGTNNRNTILKLVNEGSFIGLPVLGNPNRYPFSIYSVTECDVCFIRKETMLEIIQRNVNVSNFLLQWYADDYLYMYNKISTISTRNSHGKLATALLYLTDNQFKEDILNVVSRKDIAELASVSLESSNKILLQLKHDQIIEMDKNGIVIKRRDLIEKLSTVR